MCKFEEEEKEEQENNSMEEREEGQEGLDQACKRIITSNTYYRYL